MSWTCAAFALAALAAAPAPCPAQEKAAPDPHVGRYDDVMTRNAWWREARFGMFIHFGAYAVPARGEWVQSDERISAEKYRPYVESFRPVDFDPRAWARLARAAGMKYAVMTAKHHDGFCLCDSALTDYKITPRFGGRDLVDALGRPVPWETCLTLNNNWGYHAGDNEWEPPELVVHTLVEAVSKNGNLLLNVGPDARGRIPEPSVAVLEGEVGPAPPRRVGGEDGADLVGRRGQGPLLRERGRAHLPDLPPARPDRHGLRGGARVAPGTQDGRRELSSNGGARGCSSTGGRAPSRLTSSWPKAIVSMSVELSEETAGARPAGTGEAAESGFDTSSRRRGFDFSC